MTELSKLETKLADIDREIVDTAKVVPVFDLHNTSHTWTGVIVKSFDPRLCAMKSDCLKYIAQARVNLQPQN
jgi:hypothetical protein